jgi:LuxR family maltose regulon positive regulatory protein
MAAHVSQRRTRSGADQGALLIEAKLAPPSVRTNAVARRRVTRALDAGSDAKLTLVAAPAGYGKTTAVRAWCATRAAGLAWVTLDDGDNDPTRLWRYVATAVDRIRPGLGRLALQRLAVPGSPVENAVDELVNAAVAYERELIVVLDDLHAVTDAECLASIDRALRHLPDTAHVVAATRVDPALAIARLRAAGDLVEVRANDLSFTADEARELLVERGHIALGDEEIDALVERTEGWPAALVLAGLWLRTVDDLEGAVRGFHGDHRFVADYLSNEVLASLDEDRRAFLEGAAVLGEFTAPLCDAVLDRSGSESALADLERANLFVSRLAGGTWYRMHPLLGAYAAARLAAEDASAPERIHRSAAEWLRGHAFPLEATLHAAAAGDHDLVAELLAEQHLALIRNGASRTLLRWARTLPDDCLVRQPELAVAAATATMLLGGSTMEMRRFLSLADRGGGADRSDRNTYVDTAACLVRAATLEGGVKGAAREGHRAVELARDGSPTILTAALAAHARASFFAGNAREASVAALEALAHPEIAQATPSLVVAHATCAFAAVERGRLASAHGHAEKARDAVGQIGSGRSWLGANAAAALGVVHAAEGNLAEADRELTVAEHFFRDEVPTLHHTWLLALLARVRIGRGRLDEAGDLLRSAQDSLDELGDAGIVPALAEAVEVELGAARERVREGDVLELPSAAELAVLRLLTTELTLREIGEHLYISANTVRSHTRAVYRKLGVHTRADAVAKASALDLLSEADSPM